jgi:hypothetical protein
VKERRRRAHNDSAEAVSFDSARPPGELFIGQELIPSFDGVGLGLDFDLHRGEGFLLYLFQVCSWIGVMDFKLDVLRQSVRAITIGQGDPIDSEAAAVGFIFRRNPGEIAYMSAFMQTRRNAFGRLSLPAFMDPKNADETRMEQINTATLLEQLSIC